ncbi:DUF4236 domain-containing protein [Paeniglutamicibacter sp. NPDC091659]|uniref:DUF4236 domain-containing protein n=1 Tax=Paeniglutamicibacter sp. NPDC091659 TaxID=3364389 RepID=UPI0038283622
MRKSFKIAPGIRMTVTPKSLGLSAGVKGARISANTSGRVTHTVGIPGTGISHVSTSTLGGSVRRTATPAGNAAHAAPPAPPTPGIFAPKWEKELHRHLVAKPDLQQLKRVAIEHPAARQIAAFREAADDALPTNNFNRGIELLTWLFEIGYDPAADPFVLKYLPGRTVAAINIAEGITAELSTDHDFIGLLLAEVHQAAGNLPAAVDAVEQLTPSTVAAVSLAELYSCQRRWDDVVALTDGISNVDEAATFLLIQRAIALRELAFLDAARDAFKEALRIRSRPAALRHRALIERGRLLLAQGKRSLARKDFEKVLAEDSSYPGLMGQLDHLAD